MNSRYQFQPWYVRAYRWWRWKPWFACVGLWRLGHWAVLGLPMEGQFLDTRWRVAKCAFQCSLTQADFRMHRYNTHEEFLAELRSDLKELE